MNISYSNEQIEFIKNNSFMSDKELMLLYNETFGTNVKKASLRKKRQRLNIKKDAVLIRIEWCRLIGMDEEEIKESIESNPPVDINEEQRQLNAAKRLMVFRRIYEDVG